jgi:L-lactate dehydrogenase complex protein LldG
MVAAHPRDPAVTAARPAARPAPHSGDAREEVLARIRTALVVPAPPAPGEVLRDYRTESALDPAARLDLLADRLADYRAVVHRCTAGDAAAAVTAALRERGVRALVLPPADAVDLSGWDGERLRDDPVAPLPVTTLDTADAVLTGCAVAVAQTGTIVLDASPDQGRRALTLVPDHHLVVVRAAQIVTTVPEALPRLAPTRPLTWISGPSATSDIELNRVEGVHGPRTLEVFLIEDA